MEDDEILLTKVELQKLIQESVNRRPLMSENMMQKYQQVQSLLEQKEKLSSNLLKIYESVSKCEATVRELYSKLGWEYKDIDSEYNNCSDSGSSSGASYETDDVRSASSISNYATAADSDGDPIEDIIPATPEMQPKAAVHLKELRVVLKRLPLEQIPRRALPPRVCKRTISDDELSGTSSDYVPSGGSSDSDYEGSSTKSDRQKKKKWCKSDKVTVKTAAQEWPVSQPLKSEPPENTDITNGAAATGTPPAVNQKPEVKQEPEAKQKPAENQKPEVNQKPAENQKPEANQKPAEKQKPKVKAESKPFSVNAEIPAQTLPLVLQDLTVGMEVIAKKKNMTWETGNLTEFCEKEDGTKKFKVIFEDNGKKLVSGHHIAYNAMPKLSHLDVGARVLSKSNSENKFFTPGIIGERPSRRNHMRFLVFFDDQKTAYVALPVVRLVYKQLPNPLDDIRDEEHKQFMKEYIQRLPYPPHTQFKVSQKVRVMRDGALEPATVVLLDCSLIEVAYTKDEEREWIYRGSIRLEHIMAMKEASNK